ncbi:MAG: iron-containing redox enzyme family protein [Thermogemmatispora sp.]|uniref:iron-containing redox enzyme family protein n=1 Tax=Thermogemmatispora sp. TaxID=1968838 RepID=UPI0019E52859|nr:iron-containing redox enzyme family protein [Thermogemmatispora sp.]MBE3567743.1 iron-containing redox enzyme family protein [Thermogemmatispora sp.]
MVWFDQLLTPELRSLRERILHHPFWSGIETGTLARERLGLFALQDWLIVRDAYRLDGLAIARAAPNLELQEMLIDKLAAKKGGPELLLRFGAAVGVPRAAFAQVEPLAACLALLNFFYWMVETATPVEWLVAVGASDEVFARLCLRVYPALMRHYNLEASQVAFFSAHLAISERLTPLERWLSERHFEPAERQRLTQVIRLSHQYEIQFYDAVLQAPLASS